MIINVAVCPQAPGMVPALGTGLADELADLREAALAAVRTLFRGEPERIVVLGDGADGREGTVWDETAGGTLAGFGVDLRAGGPATVLPASLTMGAWLLDEAGWTGPRSYTSTWLDEDHTTWALLVMADGSSRQRRLAPEWVDIKGRQFDTNVASALADGDAEWLLGINLALANEVGASGIAGLVALGEYAVDAAIEPRLDYEGAPFGLEYWVADWILA